MPHGILLSEMPMKDAVSHFKQINRCQLWYRPSLSDKDKQETADMGPVALTGAAEVSACSAVLV